MNQIKTGNFIKELRKEKGLNPGGTGGKLGNLSKNCFALGDWQVSAGY